jgi:hypothetical protein
MTPSDEQNDEMKERSLLPTKRSGAELRISDGVGANVEVPWEEENRAGGGGWGATVAVWLLLVIGGLFIYHYPAQHLEKLRDAVRQGNVDFLEQNVDFGAIKTQLFAEGILGLEAENKEIRQENVSKINDYLDKNIAPRAIVNIANLSREDRPSVPWKGVGWGNFPEAEVNGWSYNNLDEVEFSFNDGSAVFLERAGLLRWRVFRVDLPREE